MRLIKILDPDVVVLDDQKFGQQVWTGGRITKKVRESRRCYVCDGPIGEKGYRPITNGNNRQERICPACIDGLIHSEREERR
jgi:hypothetical protein